MKVSLNESEIVFLLSSKRNLNKIQWHTEIKNAKDIKFGYVLMFQASKSLKKLWGVDIFVKFFFFVGFTIDHTTLLLIL